MNMSIWNESRGIRSITIILCVCVYFSSSACLPFLISTPEFRKYKYFHFVCCDSRDVREPSIFMLNALLGPPLRSGKWPINRTFIIFALISRWAKWPSKAHVLWYCTDKGYDDHGLCARAQLNACTTFIVDIYLFIHYSFSKRARETVAIQ